MRPTRSQMITLSDDMRANIAGVPALIVGGIIVLGFDFDLLGAGVSVATILVLPYEAVNLFLVFWPLFSLTYLLWTHVGLNDLDETELIVHSRWTLANRRRWWSRWFGMGGAISWATMAA